MAEFIALFRGINVGRAKRIAMADLREVFSNLGYTNVRSVLNSGNVIFSSPRKALDRLSRGIRDEVEQSFGISATVIVITAEQLRRIVESNPLLSIVTDNSRHLVAFAASSSGLEPARAMRARPWQPDALAVTVEAAYLWCVEGVLESPLAKAFARASGDVVTARNWTTVLKLHAAAAAA